jgi:predicted ferric reductase
VTWIAVYLLLVLAPLLVLMTGPLPPARGFWLDFSTALGFAAIAAAGVQFALTARIKPATAPFGVDLVYLLHRRIALLATALALAHFAVLYVRHEDLLGELDPRTARWELTAGRLALVCFVVLVVSSEFRKRLRLDYDVWRVMHVVLAIVGYGAATAHIVGVGYYTGAPVQRELWLLFTLSFVLLVVWIRLVRPAIQKGRPYQVVEVRPERGGASTLVLEPDGHDGLDRFMPGQFCWLTLGVSPFRLREHPFTIASPPERLPRVELCIKPLGNFTTTVADVRPGTVAYLDAAYGVFSFERVRDAEGLVFIVGGVGVTPAMSMLRSLHARGDRRPLTLIYASTAWDEILFREELDSLASGLDLEVVHVLSEPDDEWSGEEGFVTRDLLDRRLPAADRLRRHYFLCGPKPMIDAAQQALADLGVPPERRQIEVFDFA